MPPPYFHHHHLFSFFVHEDVVVKSTKFEDIKETTIGQHATTVAYIEEEQEQTEITKEIFLEDLETVSEVQIPGVVPHSEDSNMKEECLTTATFSSEEIEHVPLETQKEKGTYDLEEQIVEEYSNSTELHEKSKEDQKEPVIMTNFEPLHKLQAAQDGYILKCLLSPEFCEPQRYLAIASSDSTVKIWNVDCFTLEKTLVGHQRWVWDWVFSVDGAYLITELGGATAEIMSDILAFEANKRVVNITINRLIYVIFDETGTLIYVILMMQKLNMGGGGDFDEDEDDSDTEEEI
ncbi:unnamed protein product [Lactuca virosa]|uniref:Target of rapamycin complex subunit LST8 n=1 Tax=Lactuca virosa TaxID=75947 RepID=A0AAU9N107_9ASTR|nr:unnamed protein product [Lactuca virosa]